MENYRNYFKEYYNIDFSDDYEIHHIDLNHNNNNIDNLMILPKKLHNLYHLFLYYYNNAPELVTTITGNNVSNQNYTQNILMNLLEIIFECNKWYDYKMYLDGKIPNIHGIEVMK